MINYLFSFKGRINRLKYALGIITLSLINYGIGNSCNIFATNCEFFLFFIIPLLWINFALVVKRLHDIGITGWASLLMLIPIANLMLGLFLLFQKGTKGTNKYGKDPLLDSEQEALKQFKEKHNERFFNR